MSVQQEGRTHERTADRDGSDLGRGGKRTNLIPVELLLGHAVPKLLLLLVVALLVLIAREQSLDGT